VVAVDYQARDGLSIPAYVTLPPSIDGLEEARNLPFVVLPHGGPTARDFLEFDWLSQFLAHQGFGVLQMNFRGSAGYGETFRAAGDRQWGQAMQDDITDGTRWLFENGLADPDRTSILGASYGGYAALMGAVKTPDLFRCAVSINGVSDLPTVIADERDYIGGTYGTRHIGRLWGDRKMLAENSPARRADEITAPVLLIAGEEDRVVPPEHSERMRRAMERAGKAVELVTLEEGSHRLDVGNNRVLALRAIDRFLAGCR
jgi:dipeptidyl aminopeptidase/acylaminoacyl peptidase